MSTSSPGGPAPADRSIDGKTCIRRSCRRRRRTQAVLAAGVVIVAVAWLSRGTLRQQIRERATLANDAPAPEIVEEMIDQAPDRARALLEAWDSGKIVQRQVAIRSVGRVIGRDASLPPRLEAMVLSAALDPDMNVREVALSELSDRQHPALGALAAAQLQDPDPHVRLLGLTHLKGAAANIGVPLVIPLASDGDLRVAGVAVKLLENWSGMRFGAKLADTVQVENQQTGLKEFRAEGATRTMAAARQAAEWWQREKANFPPVQLSMPDQALAARQTLVAGDFRLPTLDGRHLALADLRGKVVLINFWTTWCTACVAEMPELIALQEKHKGRLAIIGVSLDFVPDSHGHLGGHAAVEERPHDHGDHDDHEATEAALVRVREKVARTVKARGINYPILLDEKNEVGGRFNGGELPTTVILDAAGNVRRRFVGARSLAVFEAMIEEASRP